MNVGCSTAATSSEDQQLPSQHCILRVRHEPFEYGLLPLPTLIFMDPATSLRVLRSKLLPSTIEQNSAAPSGDAQVNSSEISRALDLSEDDAELVLETLTSVLPDYHTDRPRASCIDDAPSVSLDYLILFLYIQNYKKPPPRPHKNTASVEDVWPSTSVFDGLISTLAPLQVRTSRKSSLSQMDEEEAHQLSFVQKHLPSLLSLLADSSGENDPNLQVLALERFNHLGILLKCRDRSSEVMPLSQVIPFFANSDPDMPAAPAPLQQILEWVQEHVSVVSERPQAESRENGPDGEVDVPMLDACTSTSNSISTSSQSRDWCQEGLTFVDGIAKALVLKSENDINGGSVKVSNCHDSAVYILAPMKYASVYRCSDSIIVLGAVEKVVRIEHCERVQLIVASVRVCITNCRECLFYLGVNQKPLILGENHNLQVAPYNTFYPQLEAHLAQVGIDPTLNRWDSFLTLGVVDPHDSLPHAAGVADTQGEGADLLPPDRYMNLVIPPFDSQGLISDVSTKANPFTLPKAYVVAQQQKNKAVDALRQMVKNAAIDESRKPDLLQAIRVHFHEWLHASGNIHQLHEFHDSDRDNKSIDTKAEAMLS